MDATSRLEFGRCRIDVPGRGLVRNGEPVEVQAKVFDLLVYLIEHRDRVVSSEELLDTLWSGVAVTPSSLSRAVHKARVAVGDDGEEQRTIATVRGRGFRFVAPLGHEREGPGGAASDFVGRTDELARLGEALERARSGEGGLVFLTGEPGIGKTRTAHELARRATARGAAVHLVRCPEGAGTPAYWPWRRLGRSLAAGRTRAELEGLAGREAADFARIAPELTRDPDVRDPPELSPEEMRLRVFEGGVSVLERVARETPLVLVLDDLHLADLPSLQFLRFLSHVLSELRVLVVGTFREAELARDEERERLVADAERSAAGKALALRPLSEFEVGRLGEKRLGHPLSGETVAFLHARCGGNPFFLIELLALLEREGEGAVAALQAGSLWLPPTVRAAVEGHLGRLGEEERRMLRIAAVFGTEFGPALLARAAEVSPEVVMGCLAAAVEAHVLEAPKGGTTRRRFAHALLRDALYQDLEEMTRARLHLRVAQVLEADAEADPSQLAFHWHQAAAVGGAERAVHHACRAADVCRSRLAFEQAARHLEQALEALELLPAESSQRRCELLIETAGCAIDFDKGKSGRLLVEALRLARGLGPSEFGSLLLATASAAAQLRLAPEELKSAVREALDSFGPGETAAQATLLAAAGRGCLRGDPGADALSARAVELARRSGDASVLGAALCSWHWVHSGPESRAGRWEAVQEIERLGPAADQEALLEGRFLRAMDALERADRAALLSALEDLETGAREAGHALSRWRALSCRSLLATLEGCFAQADRLSSEALALGRRNARYALDAFIVYASQQARGAFLRRDTEAFGEGYRVRAAGAPGVPVAELALACWHVERDDLVAAHECLERCSREDLLAGPPDLLVVHMLATVSSALRERALCEALRPILLPYRDLFLVECETVMFYGPAARYLALVSWALEDWESADEWFGQAIAVCEALEACAELLIVRTDYSRMLAERGRQSDRRAAREQLALARTDATRLALPGVLRRLEGVAAKLRVG